MNLNIGLDGWINKRGEILKTYGMNPKQRDKGNKKQIGITTGQKIKCEIKLKQIRIPKVKEKKLIGGDVICWFHKIRVLEPVRVMG